MIIRQASESDFDAIYDLFLKNDYFDELPLRSEFIAYCQWLFSRNPTGIHYQLVADRPENQTQTIVAHYGLVPLHFVLGGKRIVVGLGSNLLIDSGYRDGMLFLSLQRQFLRGYPQAGASFIYGLVTRPQVLQTHLRTGYSKVGYVPVLARPFKADKLVERVVRIPFFIKCMKPLVWFLSQILYRLPIGKADRRFATEEVSSFPEEVSEFSSRFFASHSIHALRDQNTLNWRFSTPSPRTYRIFLERFNGSLSGYMVVRCMKMMDFKVLAIIDMMVDPQTKGAGRALFSRIGQLSREYEVDLAASICTPYSHLHSLFRRAHFMRTPAGFTLVVNRPKSFADSNDILNFSNWHLTWFDSDVT